MHGDLIDTEDYAPSRRPHLRRAGALVAALVCLALLAAACSSGSSSPGVAQVGSTTTATGSGSSSSTTPSGSSALAFSSCMQSHGEPNFPDPNSSGATAITSGSGLDPKSPQFKAAQEACQKLAPSKGTQSPAQQAQSAAQALKFSECMQSHGEPNFPDPNSQGGIQITNSSGLNPSSPQFQAAQNACQKVMPGLPIGTASNASSGSGGKETIIGATP